MTKKRLQIRGMHCVSCAMNIDGTLEDLIGVKSASTNYARQWVEVEYDEQKITEQQLILAIQDAGYEAVLST